MKTAISLGLLKCHIQGNHKFVALTTPRTQVTGRGILSITTQQDKSFLLRLFLAHLKDIFFGDSSKFPLNSSLKFNPSFLLTFAIIFATPLESALMHQLLPVLYKPRCRTGSRSWGKPPLAALHRFILFPVSLRDMKSGAPLLAQLLRRRQEAACPKDLAFQCFYKYNPILFTYLTYSFFESSSRDWYKL